MFSLLLRFNRNRGTCIVLLSLFWFWIAEVITMAYRMYNQQLRFRIWICYDRIINDRIFSFPASSWPSITFIRAQVPKDIMESHLCTFTQCVEKERENFWLHIWQFTLSITNKKGICSRSARLIYLEIAVVL